MKSTATKPYIIAIGASAGGLDALTEFFDNTPLDKASYVVIQHLSPMHQSRLSEILSRHSKLEIILAEDRMKVEPNKVYVIPNKSLMTIEGGQLRLTKKETKETPHMTVDEFFTSLAGDKKFNPVGVVLSGTGSDGSKGVEAIRKAGGWVLAQNPDTANFNGMPASAINTGCVNEVLPPKEMPGAIQAYVKKKPTGQKQAEANPENEQEGLITEILELMRERLPVDFTEYKRSTIFRRVKKRMAERNLNSMEAYRALLQTDPAELEMLSHEFLISVTAFFRDPMAYEVLERVVIPELFSRSEGRALKVWVAGCATGQEAYSLAILIQEYQQANGLQREVKIFATDLDKNALNLASRGIYPDTIESEMSPERLEQFFTHEGGHYHVKFSIRQMLIFAQHDLVRNPPYCNVDLISCRNVFIYLNPTLQQKIFGMLHFGLREGGFLFLGTSENNQLLSTHFEEIDKKWRIFRKTGKAPAIQVDSLTLAASEEIQRPIPPFRQIEETLPRNNPMADAIIDALLQQSGQAGVCIDHNLRVVHSYGDLSPFLLPKVFNFYFKELLPEPLQIAFGLAVARAVEENRPVTMEGIPNLNTRHNSIRLMVKPLFVSRNSQMLILVLLSQEFNPLWKNQPVEWFNQNRHTLHYIGQLEEQLQTGNERLQMAFEKLESNNENMQAFNEELLSANEEMQSSNEELQSVNEELQTINSEHQSKIKELMQVNDDLNNYFRSNSTGLLFVNRELQLTRYSPSAVQHINLRESDIGRPISHLTTNIQFDSLVADIEKVVASGKTLVREVRSNSGSWYQVTLTPYIRDTDARPDGATVTFFDITRLKTLHHELNTSYTRLLSVKTQLENIVQHVTDELEEPVRTMGEVVIKLLGKEKQTATEVTEKVRSLETNISKVKTQLLGLAEASRDSGPATAVPKLLSLTELLEDIRLGLLDQITEEKIHLTWTLEENFLHFSPKALRSILYTLIQRAIWHRAPGRHPRIEVTSHKSGTGNVILTISDNGKVISEERLKTMFDPDAALEGKSAGENLSLYTVKQLMETAGGKIRITSSEGSGTQVKLQFPQ